MAPACRGRPSPGSSTGEATTRFQGRGAPCYASRPMHPFLAALERRVIVFDGAMGTRLYEKGVFHNRSYDELCLSSPGLVQEVHAEYVKAGAHVIETNTFGAN